MIRGCFSVIVALLLSFSIARATHHAPVVNQLAGYAMVPLTKTQFNRLLVDVKINGADTTLILDTGSPVSLLARNQAVHFGLQPVNVKGHSSIAINGHDVELEKITKFQIGPIASSNLLICVGDHLGARYDRGQLAGIHVTGLLGANFLIEHGAIIDIQRGELFLKADPHAKDLFDSTLRTAGWTPVPFSIENTKLVVPTKVDSLSVPLCVDSGSCYTLLSQTFCEHAGIKGSFLTFASGVIYKPDALEQTVKIDDLQVGSFDTGKQEISASHSFDLVKGIDKKVTAQGLLGIDILGNNLAF
ncbi:MAG: aspartyl protease family protein, partial [Chthoniobacteraceae bacterium]